MVETAQIQEQQLPLPIPEPKPTVKWWAMLGIGLGSLMISVDVSIVYIALPTMVKNLHTNFATVQWVTLSYLLVISAVMLSAGRMGDIFGKKGLFIGGLILFTISSLLCGIAPNVGYLIAFRGLQGLGAVFISALGTAIVTELFPNSGRGSALGIIGAINAVGIALGATLGGLLTALGGWRLIFLVNVPIGIIATVIVAYFVPAYVRSEVRQRFDLLGAIIMAVTLTCFALGMTQGQLAGFSNPIALTLLAVSAIGLICFLAVESRRSQPMLQLKIFTNLQFSLNLLVSWMVFLLMSGTIFLLPFFLELTKHYPMYEIGLLQGVLPVTSALIAPISGNLSDRFGSRPISSIGLALMICAFVAIGWLDSDFTVLGYTLRIALLGLGVGIFLSPNNSAIMGSAPQEHLGSASGLASLMRILGNIVSVPLMGALFTAFSIRSAVEEFHATSLQIRNLPIEALISGEHATFEVVTAIAIVALGLLIFAMLTDKQGLREEGREELGERGSFEL